MHGIEPTQGQNIMRITAFVVARKSDETPDKTINNVINFSELYPTFEKAHDVAIELPINGSPCPIYEVTIELTNPQKVYPLSSNSTSTA